jgi:hypothetical protein
MGGATGDMLAAARRDPNFRGIDPDALGQLVKQATDAGNAIRSWLSAHQPPPGVPATGYTQAAEAGQWVGTQLGMLTRRRNYALTHPDPGGGVTVPPPAGRLGSTGSGRSGGGATTGIGKGTPSKPKLTPHGAGPDLGHYPTHQAAVKAAATDALAIKKAEQNHAPIPAKVWQHLKANVHDPDYTQALYDRLGPVATAGLIAAAGHDKVRLREISTSLGIADHHLVMDEKWLRALLDASGRLHDRTAAVQVLSGAHFTPKTAAALKHVLGLGHVTQATFSPVKDAVIKGAAVKDAAVPHQPNPRPADLTQVSPPGVSPPGMTTAQLNPHLVSHRLGGECATPRSHR